MEGEGFDFFTVSSEFNYQGRFECELRDLLGVSIKTNTQTHRQDYDQENKYS